MTTTDPRVQKLIDVVTEWRTLADKWKDNKITPVEELRLGRVWDSIDSALASFTASEPSGDGVGIFFDSREDAFQANCHGDRSAATLADYCNNKVRAALRSLPKETSAVGDE